MSDPIADLLTRIRNASAARKPTVEIPASGLKVELAKVFEKHGFIKKFVVVDDGKQGMMKILLSYKEGEPVIQGIERVSTPGRRQYAGAEQMPRILDGLGYAVVSTSHGLLTDTECRRQNVGGEVICKIW
jgi:small subunit ribosomal protein S8